MTQRTALFPRNFLGWLASGALALSCAIAHAGAGNITVGPKGVHLQRDGIVWTPHGVVMVAFECAPTAFANQPQYLQLANQQYYNDPNEFSQMLSWGADTVRIMVSQPGTDPQDPNGLYAQAYVTHIQDAVIAARAVGLNVILNLQDESPSGDPHPNNMPTAATTRSWQKLAPLFNSDLGILYEIFNEPGLGTGQWQTWQTDMNALIGAIRATRSSNVILVDGLAYGNSFEGQAGYPLTDSANSTAFAVHPYFHSDADQVSSHWDTTFGTLAATSPMVVTEWYPGKVFWCDAATAQATLNLLQYLSSKGIGITAFAYDFPDDATLDITGSVNQDYLGTMPTTLVNETCTDKPWGPGTLLQNWYRTGMVPNQLQ